MEQCIHGREGVEKCVFLLDQGDWVLSYRTVCVQLHYPLLLIMEGCGRKEDFVYCMHVCISMKGTQGRVCLSACEYLKQTVRTRRCAGRGIDRIHSCKLLGKVAHIQLIT